MADTYIFINTVFFLRFNTSKLYDAEIKTFCICIAFNIAMPGQYSPGIAIFDNIVMATYCKHRKIVSFLCFSHHSKVRLTFPVT